VSLDFGNLRWIKIDGEHLGTADRETRTIELGPLTRR
jgi:hypothetical protein